jgi:NADP-dependent 3-hydroxy acid dehydrogenase YdfG
MEQPNITAGARAGKFAGQTAVITGASSGIGRAIAQKLGTHGAKLCLPGRAPEKLQALGIPRPPMIYGVDLTVPGEIEDFVADSAAKCGRVDILVHSAGVIGLGAMENASLEELDRQLNVNLRAPYLLTQALLPMLKASRGQIVFINSTAGLSAGAGSGQYAASKHALKAVADSLRDEVNAAGVRVLNVFVGRTATPMQAKVHAVEGRPYCPGKLIQPQDVASVVCHLLALPRTVEVTAVHLRPADPPAL